MSPFGIPLDSARINSALKNSYWRVSVVDITGSTQNDLTASVRKNEARHGDVLVAEFQSSGRGRLDRNFEALPGRALLLSFYIVPNQQKRELEWLPLLAGQALCASLEELAAIDSVTRPLLKWPNDILINDRKVGGILTERIDSKNGVGVVIGIGINFFSTQDELPISNATSFHLEGLEGFRREEVLISFLLKMTVYLDRWDTGDLSLIDEYRDRSATLGRAISIELPNGEKLESRAISIERSGALLLENGREITVGDVVHLRTN